MDASKVAGYAVTGGHDEKLTVTKIAAYAVTNDADVYVSASKVVAYAVTEGTATQTARPQIFVCC